MPVPERVAPAEALPEDAVKVRFPLAAPLDCGWNVIVTGTLCPGDRVSGRLTPLTENSELVRLPAVTVTFAPDADKLIFLVAVAPTVTFPKLSELGESASWPVLVLVPVPDSAIEIWLPLLATIAIAPAALPALVGRYTTENVMLCPPASVKGAVNPEILKGFAELLLDSEIWLMPIDARAVLLIETD